MKQFLKILLKFLLLLFPFYVLIIFLWEMFIPRPFKPNLIYKPNTGMLEKRLHDLHNTSKVDVLFLGSSKAYRGFDPRIFKKNGLTAFNLGSSTQTHVQTRYLLNKYLDDLNPKLVVYEVYPDLFSSDGVESGINVISAAENIDGNLIDHVVSINDIQTYNTFLIKCMKVLFHWDNEKELDGKNVSDSKNDTYIKGGYVERDEDFQKYALLNDKTWMPLEDQLESFEKNIEILNSRNIPFILVLTPFNFRYFNQNEIDKYLSGKGRLINYNEILDFSATEDFYDEHHLNQKAVEKLNNHFVNIIIESLRDNYSCKFKLSN